MAESKRVLVLSDMHCGSIVGLTHPDYFNYHKNIQKVLWDFYINSIKKIGPVDLMISLGDLIDGPGKKGSRQHITTDLEEQTDMAIAAIEMVKTKKHIFVRGTTFHVEDSMEHENRIAKHFDSPIADAQKIDINGCILHCKHTTGKGSASYGSATPLQSGAINQLLCDAAAGNVKADIFIRGHVHEFINIERIIGTMISLPALQMKGMAYGRRYSGYYDLGIVWLDIRSKTDYDVNKILLDTGGSAEKEKVIRI